MPRIPAIADFEIGVVTFRDVSRRRLTPDETYFVSGSFAESLERVNRPYYICSNSESARPDPDNAIIRFRVTHTETGHRLGYFMLYHIEVISVSGTPATWTIRAKCAPAYEGMDDEATRERILRHMRWMLHNNLSFRVQPGSLDLVEWDFPRPGRDAIGEARWPDDCLPNARPYLDGENVDVTDSDDDTPGRTGKVWRTFRRRGA